MIQAKTKPIVYDVVLSYSVRDEAQAAVVMRKLGEAGLSVFSVSDLEIQGDRETGEKFAEALREALVESSALVVLLTPAHRDSPALGVEVGAAWIGQKPVFVLVAGDSASDVPVYLRRYHVSPLSQLSQVIPAIARLGPSGGDKQ